MLTRYMTFEPSEPLEPDDPLTPPGDPDPTGAAATPTPPAVEAEGTSVPAIEPAAPADTPAADAPSDAAEPVEAVVPELTVEEIAAAAAAAVEAARVAADIEEARQVVERAMMRLLAADTTVPMPATFTRQQIVAYQAAEYSLIADQAVLQAANMAITARLVESSRTTALRLADYDEANIATAPHRPHRWSPLQAAMVARTTSLGAKLGMSDASISKLTLTSQMLVQDLPEALEALEDGAISMKHADILADHASQMPRKFRRTFDAVMTPVAKKTVVPRLSAKAKAAREKLHPSTFEERHEVAVKKRCVILEPGKDGMSTLTAYLPAIAASGIMNRLTDTGKAMKSPDDGRTLAQLRADVLQDLLVNGELSAESCELDIKARILVLVDYSTLVGEDNKVAQLDGYGAVGAEQVRQIASSCNQLVRVIRNPVSKEILNFGGTTYRGSSTGVLAIRNMLTDPIVPNIVGTDLRFAPRVLRELIWLRDQTCRWIGCGRSARNCELDHTIPWEEGGPGGFKGSLQHGERLVRK